MKSSSIYEPFGLRASAILAARRKYKIRTKYDPHVGAKELAKKARRANGN